MSAETLRLTCRGPMDGPGLLAFLALRAVPGVEEVTGGTYRRVLDLAYGAAVVALTPGAGGAACELRLEDPRDRDAAIACARRLLDLDADAGAIDAVLRADPALAGFVRARPGVRVPGTADGAELAVLAVLGQQVSVAGARTLAGRLVARAGAPVAEPDGALTHRFPRPEAIAALDPATLGLTRARARALRGLCTALAAGDVVLEPDGDRAAARAALLALPGIGPWTADYVAMRALRDPDAFLPGDLHVRRALTRLGLDVAHADHWRPYRAYATMRLWHCD